MALSETVPRTDGAVAATTGARPRVSIVVPIGEGGSSVVERLGTSASGDSDAIEIVLVCALATAEAVRATAQRRGYRLVIAPDGTPDAGLAAAAVASTEGSIVLMLGMHETLSERYGQALHIAGLPRPTRQLQRSVS